MRIEHKLPHMHREKKKSYMHINIPAWETALAVEHVLKKRAGTVAACAFYKSCFYEFSRGNRIMLK